MKTIAFVTQKGGAGKTTLSASIAVAAGQAGEKVIALDMDPQASLMSWSIRRGEIEGPGVDRLTPDRALKLPQILARLEQLGFTLVVIDCPGFSSTAGNHVLEHVDLALVPARPTRLDLEAAMPTTRTLARFNRPILFILNQCPPGKNSSRAAEAAAGLSAIGALAVPNIQARADHQDAIAAGQGVTEYAPEGKGAAEIRALWTCISRTLVPVVAMVIDKAELVA